MTDTIKIASHPSGEYTIAFNEQYHTYTDNLNKKYISGTSFPKSFFPKFDAIAVSIKCSESINPKYTGRTPADIRAEWKKEGYRGRTEGDNVHLYAEMSVIDPNKQPAPISARCESLFKQVDHAFAIFHSKNFRIIAVEKIVFSPDLGIAGMIDLLLHDIEKNEIIVGDWKQNKKALSTTNTFQNLLKPLEHLQDTEINRYSLQLSLYQYLMEREGYFPDVSGYRRVIFHLTPEAVVPIQLEYFEYEIEELLRITRRI